MSIEIKYQNDDKLCRFYSFEEIINYDKVVCIKCWDNQLCVLPKLPNSLKTLWYGNNQLIKKIIYKYLKKMIYN